MGEDEEQKQSLGSQMSDYAKQTAINAGKNAVKNGAKQAAKVAGKAIGGIIKKAVAALVQFLVSTAPYWLPVVIILVVAIMALTLILDLFSTESEEDLSGFSTFSSTEMFYDYMRIWECTTLYKYRIGEGDGGKYVGPNGYYAVYYGGSKDQTYNLAYGIVISRNYNVDHFAKVLGKTESETETILYSYTTDGQEFTDLSAEGVESIFEEIVEEKRTYVKNKLGDTLASQLKQCQIDALAAVAYQYGNIGNFKEAYSYYTSGQKDTFRSNFKANGYTPFLQGWEGVNRGNNNRATSNWNLFDTGVYSGGGYILDPSDYGAYGGSGSGATGGTETQVYSDTSNGYSTIFTVGSREYKNYKQSYGPWASQKTPGEEKMSSSGCGITSIAVLLSGYGYDYDPGEMSTYIKEKYGSSYSLVKTLSDILGVDTSYVTSNVKQGILNQLREGNACLVHVPANSIGPWTTASGHYFVILAISEDGTQVYVSDVGGYYTGKGRNGWVSTSKLGIIDKYIKLPASLGGGSSVSNPEVSELTEIYYSGQKLTDSTGGRRYAQSFAITDVGTSNEIVWYAYDGKNSDWSTFYVRGYEKSSETLVYKRNYICAGHQAFDVYKNSDGYYIYTGSYGTSRYDYYSKSVGIAQHREIILTTNSLDKDVSATGKHLNSYISAISVDDSRIAVLKRLENSTVEIYSLNKNNMNMSKLNSFSISSAGKPIQGIDLVGNKIYVVAGYGTYSAERYGMYVYCYNINTGNIEWSTEKITVALNSWEPQGIRVYSYNGNMKIFILISNKASGQSQIYCLN